MLLKTDKFFDLTGSLSFFTIVLASLIYGGSYHARQTAVTVLVLVWSGRLGTFLFKRILATGKDSRFDDIKGNPREDFWQSSPIHTPAIILTPAHGMLAGVCMLVMLILKQQQQQEIGLNPQLVCAAVKFLAVWLGQALWVWVTLLPVLILNSSRTDNNFQWSDVVGAVLWVVGFSCEVISRSRVQLVPK